MGQAFEKFLKIVILLTKLLWSVLNIDCLIYPLYFDKEMYTLDRYLIDLRRISSISAT